MKIALSLCAVAFSALVLAGCSSKVRPTDEITAEGLDAARQAVRDVVPEAERQETLLGLVDELDTLITAQSRDLQETFYRLHDLNADPNVEREALETELEAVLGRRRERRTKALDVHFRMIELTSAKEWKQVSKGALAAVAAIRDTGGNKP